MKTATIIPMPSVARANEAIWNVYYRNKNSNRLCRYCMAAMDYATAEQQAAKFNAMYPDKQYPNGKGWYPFSQAWIDYH